MADFIKAAELSELEEGELLPIEVDSELVCLAMVEGAVYAIYIQLPDEE